MGGDEMSAKACIRNGETDSERPIRMKEWLIQQIEGGKYDGLEWLDESKTIFKVPWIHAKKRGYCAERDAALFRAWARHTGKYKGEGDATTWKINFRCALNGLKDIVELKDDQTENYRVYRILPDTGKTRRSGRVPSHAAAGMKRPPHFEGSYEGGFQTVGPICFPYPAGIFQAPVPEDPNAYLPICQPWKPMIPNPSAPAWNLQPPTDFSYQMPLEEQHMKQFQHPPQVQMNNKIHVIHHPGSIPPPYPNPDGSYNEYIGEPSPKMPKSESTVDQNCIFNQPPPVYHDAISNSASTSPACSPVNIEETSQSPQQIQHASPLQPTIPLGYGQTSVPSPCDKMLMTPYDYHPLTPPQASPPAGPFAIQVSMCSRGRHILTETFHCIEGVRIYSEVYGGLSPKDDQFSKASIKIPTSVPLQEGMARGIVLTMRNGDVCLHNKSSFPCYYGNSPNGLLDSIDPESSKVIFDSCTFKRTLEAHLHGQGETPNPSIAVSVCEPWGQGRPLSQNTLTLIIKVLQADSELNKYQVHLPQALEFFPMETPVLPHYDDETLHPHHHHPVNMARCIQTTTQH